MRLFTRNGNGHDEGKKAEVPEREVQDLIPLFGIIFHAYTRADGNFRKWFYTTLREGFFFQMIFALLEFRVHLRKRRVEKSFKKINNGSK